MNYSLLQPHTVNLYSLKEKKYKIQEVEARSLLVSERFDLFAKLYYAANRKRNRLQAIEVYNAHIKAFNPDLKEPGRSDKNGYDDFITTFDNLLDKFKDESFDSSKSLVPVDENGVILDGAHRVAALAFYNKKVSIIRFDSVKNKSSFNFEYFLKRGLSWADADIIANEMVKWCPNMFIACLWPRMGDKKAKQIALNVINEKYSFGYVKTIKVNLESFVHLIAKVYEAQSWIGNFENNFAGARDKALNCFGPNKHITFVLFEASKLSEVLALKENLRLKFKSDKHSIHITDNVNETKAITDVLLNPSELVKWNTLSTSFVQKIREIVSEKLYYFKHVTLINLKVKFVKFICKIQK